MKTECIICGEKTHSESELCAKHRRLVRQEMEIRKVAIDGTDEQIRRFTLRFEHELLVKFWD